jgi:hypothetical protein
LPAEDAGEAIFPQSAISAGLKRSFAGLAAPSETASA